MTTPTASQWNRQAISTGLNDMQYQLHGFQMALRVLKVAGITLDQARTMRVLDYGCGTGKVTRVLALMFREAVGYDPSPDCLMAAVTECPPWDRCRLENNNYVLIWPAVEQQRFDVVCAINVLEHLNDDEAMQAYERMLSVLKPGGKVVMWINPAKTPTLAGKLGCQKLHHEIVVWTKPLE